MPLNVYYLDDEDDLLEIFAETFSDDTCKVTTFNNPEKFLQACKVTPPDVVIVDYRLPGTTGDHVALQLDPALPKAILSGDLTLDLKANFQQRFEKPVSVEKITEFLDKFKRST